ncbi:protein phosphatase 2C domain-containing protein [Mycobacterium antarcticum]|uniref:protein phosphatase 2C domain-containing protein n=1 Tax=Mycolicibacterium sp. TUM20984 TaxID=3023368 RepID=UPI0024E17F92|nr:protein phosphatase 2C domain-containing protein [Mycolicibacterium sp. TUM20984]
MSGEPAACPRCATPVGSSDRFCESCGGPLFDAPPEPTLTRVAIPRSDPVESACTECGNGTFSDGYCSECGHRRTAPDRDEARLGEAVLVTDRGLLHQRNEDAAAAGTVTGLPGRQEALAVVVCDGVSTSGEPQVASAAASKAGVEGMLTVLAAAGTTHAAVVAGLVEATRAATDAGAGLDPANAPSCTYTGAAVAPKADGAVEITVGNVGDSRAYWLPDPPGLPQQLTVDDSVAQELMTAGAAPNSEFVLGGAHTITRWLGADSEAKPWSDSSVRTITVVEPGSLLLCSDGLWNYLPDAADIARFCSGAEPTAAARALTAHALQSGGSDNITVVVIPIGGSK